MPKWKTNASEFIVSVNYHETRGYQCNIPKPIIEYLGDPDHIKFSIVRSKNKVELEGAEKSSSK